jgi:hypothetical protein
MPAVLASRASELFLHHSRKELFPRIDTLEGNNQRQLKERAGWSATA